MSPELTTLTGLFKEHFGLNLSRIKCLSLLISSLFSLRTVSLWKLGEVMEGDCKVSSHYRRLRRFVSEVSLPQRSVAMFLATVSGLYNQDKWSLVIDRTNWRIGKTHINILYLGACCNNMCIPLFGRFLRVKNKAILTI